MYQRLTGTGRFLFLHYNVKFRGSKTAGTGTTGYKTMPYRFQKPPIIVNGQKLFSHNADPQWMPCCDRCGELAATTAKLYTELAVDKWWKWFSYPKFSCQEEAFMGCERHRRTRNSFSGRTGRIIHPASIDEMAAANGTGGLDPSGYSCLGLCGHSWTVVEVPSEHLAQNGKFPLKLPCMAGAPPELKSQPHQNSLLQPPGKW
jgi:hypothetical protein